MNSVIYLKALIDPAAAPCLVLIDMQQEYLAKSRLIALPDVEGALSNCRAALEHARASGFPIAFLRQTSRSAFFNPSTTFADWIDGFLPIRSDMIFERSQPSGYSSKHFAEFMESCGGHFALAGFAGETACLSTAIEAFHRRHPFVFLADASASHDLDDLSARDTHRAISKIVEVYGRVQHTKSWVEQTSSRTAIAGSKADGG